MKLDEPLTWPEFFRGMALAMAVGFTAALCALVPLAIVWSIFDRVTGR